MSWTQGMLQHANKLDRAAEGRQGLEYIYTRLYALNYTYAWCSDTKDTLWPIVNRMLWRFQAMYKGGDCHLADFAGYAPHERLWQKGHRQRNSEYRNKVK